ncbi:APC family permease [Planctomyces sp. SH-PL62]|uniref:APC family permease n=1 Tax=Planctomyces sp. SH-PL62 TaxID=1636152 RepID=UPI00078E1F05|nr:amino acid permease [Planctomyces sp. SH-PL62]AMV37159.1 Serine/threonine exchanger SteT [Planctomyces sp. SH-PL62]
MASEPSEPAKAAKSRRAPALVRDLGVLDAAMLVMGSMIGSGVFITSAESARLVGAPGWLMAAWALAGLMTVAGAVSSAELAGMMPKAGGQYYYLRTAYGPVVGFLFGWSMFLVVQTGTIAAVAVAFAKFLGVFIPAVSDKVALPALRFGPYALRVSTQQAVAATVIVGLTLANTRGLKLGKLIQNSFTLAKTGALVGLILVGVLLGASGKAAAWTASWWDPWANGWTPNTYYTEPLPVDGYGAVLLLLGLAMIGPLFSSTAWNNVTFVGEEIRDPSKTLPRALFRGTSVVVALYLLANVSYLVSLPFSEIQNAPQDRVGTAAMEAAVGSSGRYLMAGAILISTFGCVNGLILAGARVFYAMARDRLFFQAAARTNAHHVPAVALYAQGIWACLLTLPVTVSVREETGEVVYGNLYSELLEYIIPVDMAFCIVMVAAVIVLRKKASFLSRPYKTFAYPLPPVVYITLATLLVVDFLYLKPLTSGVGFLIVLAGLPVYLLWDRVRSSSSGRRTPKPEPASE